MRAFCANAPLCAALIRSVAIAWGFLALRDSCVIAFARIIQSESAQETKRSKMDTQTMDYTGGLDCLRRRLWEAGRAALPDFAQIQSVVCEAS